MWSGAHRYEFFWRRQVIPPDRDAAVSFLREHQNQPGAINELRSLLMERAIGGGMTGLSDDRVIDEVANLIASGVLVAGFRGIVTRVSLEEEGRDEQPARSAPAARSAAPKPAEDGPTFSSGHDPASQAGALKAAAEAGVPFCEECAKAAA